MGKKFQLTHIDEKKPPQGSIKEGLSKSVLVYDENKIFIGADHYSLKFNQFCISRFTAKYWLEEITKPSEDDLAHFAEAYNQWLLSESYADTDIIHEFDWKDCREFIKKYINQ